MRGAFLLLAISTVLAAQPAGDTKQRVREVRGLARAGSETIPRIVPFLSDPDVAVRIEAVRALVAIGTQHSIDPLIAATRDAVEEIQLRAVDGIVNFYFPGYVSSSRVDRVSTAIRSQFERESTDVLDPSVYVREDAILAIGKVASGGISMTSRANAARALGILRGKAAIPDLAQALRSKNTELIFESLIALQKIGDPSSGSSVSFLIRDLEPRVQLAAIETTGMLQNREAIPDLQKLYEQAKNDRVRSAVLTALSMMPDESSRTLFEQAVSHKNDRVRASAAEGLGRLRRSTDRSRIELLFNDESKMAPRLAAAFASVSLGNTSTGEFAPLTYLVQRLNNKTYRGVAEPYLIELARDEAVRKAIAGFLRGASADEKIGLARVLAASGGQDVLPHLEALAKDPDTEVAQEGVRSLRNLRARMP